MIGANWKVHIERRWERETVRVYVYRSDQLAATTTFLVSLGEDKFKEEVISFGAQDGPPLLELPAHVFAAIVGEGAAVLPPDRAQGAHLDDAVKVRDRLLTMLEKERSS